MGESEPWLKGPQHTKQSLRKRGPPWRKTLSGVRVGKQRYHCVNFYLKSSEQMAFLRGIFFVQVIGVSSSFNY